MKHKLAIKILKEKQEEYKKELARLNAIEDFEMNAEYEFINCDMANLEFYIKQLTDSITKLLSDDRTI